jgi:glutamine synthetase
MEIKYETYSKDIHIEARTMLELTGKYFLPAMIRGAGKLAEFINAIEQAGGDASVQRNLLTELSGLIKKANEAKRQLEEVTKQAERHPAGRTQAVLYRDNVVPAMEALRRPVDAAEMILDKEMWPVPSYADLMFEI